MKPVDGRFFFGCFLSGVMVEHIHCFPSFSTYFFHPGWSWVTTFRPTQRRTPTDVCLGLSLIDDTASCQTTERHGEIKHGVAEVEARGQDMRSWFAIPARALLIMALYGYEHLKVLNRS